MVNPKNVETNLENSEYTTISDAQVKELLEYQKRMDSRLSKIIYLLEHSEVLNKELIECFKRMNSQLAEIKCIFEHPEELNKDKNPIHYEKKEESLQDEPDFFLNLKINIQTREITYQNRKVLLNYNQFSLLKIAIEEKLSEIHWLWGYVLFPKWRRGGVQNPKEAFSVRISRLIRELKKLTEIELFKRAVEGCHPFKYKKFELNNLPKQNIMIEVRQCQEVLAFWPRLVKFVKIDPKEKHHLHKIENTQLAKLDGLEKKVLGDKCRDNFLEILDFIKSCQIDSEKWISLYEKLSESFFSKRNRKDLDSEIQFFLDIIDNLKNWIKGIALFWRIDVDPKTIPPLCISFLMELIKKLPVYNFKSLYALKKYIKKHANQIWEQIVCEKYDITPTILKYIVNLSEISKYLCIIFEKDFSNLQTLEFLSQINRDDDFKDNFFQMLFNTLKKSRENVNKDNLRDKLIKMNFFSWKPIKVEDVKVAIMKMKAEQVEEIDSTTLIDETLE